jgi:DNA-binding transcriptional regulator YhcF (GntR family)
MARKPRTYQELKDSGIVRRGRTSPTLSKAETAKRLERERVANRQRQEARRRAAMVLQHNYRTEFSELYKQELANIQSEDV